MKIEIIKCDNCKKECDEFAINYSYRRQIEYTDETELVKLEFCDKKCMELFLFGPIIGRTMQCLMDEIGESIPKRTPKRLRISFQKIINSGVKRAIKILGNKYPHIIK